MTTEWIDVVDTAVKIGLGALISGVIGHLAYTKKHDNERKNEEINVRREMLLLAVENSDEYFQYLSDYFSKLEGLTRSGSKNPKDEGFWRKAEDWIQESEDNLLDARGCVYIAQSRLQLLGNSNVFEALGNVKKLETNLRGYYLALREKQELPTRKQLIDWAADFMKEKNTFQQLASEEFREKCL